MKFEYDETTNVLKFESYKGNFAVSPIYFIRCKCGTPIKAYFTGKPPYNTTDMDSLGFGTIHSYGATYRLIKHAKYGWGFWLKKSCPKCNRDMYLGKDEVTAVRNFIRQRLTIKDAEISTSKARDLIDRLHRDPAAQEFFSFHRDELSKRPDFVLAVNSDSNYDAYMDMLEELNLTYCNEEYWTEGNREQQAHFDLEAETLAAHDDECTCNLCME